MRTEVLPDGRQWLRIADPSWDDPVDPTFAAQRGGRWNSPGSHATLYLNDDLRTARANLRSFIADWPYEPEDLDPKTAPVLVAATLPRGQEVADAHSPAGLAGLDLPTTYPLDANGDIVGHDTCQPIGVQARADGLRGVHCRSAQVLDGSGRELAWFPATSRSRAAVVAVTAFPEWFWDPPS